MDVYFLRHADAGRKEAWSGPDSARPLSKEGIEQARQAAAAVAALQPGIQLIISSPLLRARQTAELFSAAQKPRAELREDERLAPGFGRDELAELVRENAGLASLMLVGHEPDFSLTIAACIGGGRVECKKGGVARVEIDESPSLKGTLVWLLPPKVLGR
jgi:phosphohistidine phosphatase